MYSSRLLNMVVPMVVSVMGICVFRLGWIWGVYPMNPTRDMLYLSYPISWIMTFAVHFGCYVYLKKKRFSGAITTEGSTK